MQFAAAIKSALATVRSATGVTVTYQRGSDTVELTATPGRSEFDIDVAGVGIERSSARDYLIAPSDLILDGNQVEPQRHDQIIEDDGTTTRTYEVLTLADKPAWRWTDQFRTEMRIHTKLIAEAAS